MTPCLLHLSTGWFLVRLINSIGWIARGVRGQGQFSFYPPPQRLGIWVAMGCGFEIFGGSVASVGASVSSRLVSLLWLFSRTVKKKGRLREAQAQLMFFS